MVGNKCTLEVRNGSGKRIRYEDGMDTKKALALEKDYHHNAALFAGRNGKKGNVIYSIKQYDDITDMLVSVIYFKDSYISEEEIDELIRKNPNSRFGIIYNAEKCAGLYKEEMSRHIAPITLKEANQFVTDHHRHHDSVTGCKFAVGLYKSVKGRETLIGTAICGRPVSRVLDNGLTLEINRLCVTDKDNSCSMLYGACCRIAKEMGYRKVITYVLETEPGTSLKASNFVLEDAHCGGKNWSGKRKRSNNSSPEVLKQRWAKMLA